MAKSMMRTNTMHFSTYGTKLASDVVEPAPPSSGSPLGMLWSRSKTIEEEASLERLPS